jgi:hypothetical protein
MHHPLQRKIFVRFLAIISMLGALTLLSSTVWFHRTQIREAQERVQLDLRAAHRLLLARSGRTPRSWSSGQAGELPPDRMARLYRTAARRNAFDVGGCLPADGGPGERILSGKAIAAAPDWLTPLRRRPAGSGFVLLPMEELAEENPALAERIRSSFPMFPTKSRAFSRSEVLVAVAWVTVPANPGQPAVVVRRAGAHHNNDGGRDPGPVSGSPAGNRWDLTLFRVTSSLPTC